MMDKANLWEVNLDMVYHESKEKAYSMRTYILFS